MSLGDLLSLQEVPLELVKSFSEIYTRLLDSFVVILLINGEKVQEPNMSLKFLFRGPSSRLETLIEKIQQNKDTHHHQGDNLLTLR